MEKKETKKELVSFLDAVSRTVIGKRIEETEEYVDVTSVIPNIF